MKMFDGKAVGGTLATFTSASSSWIDIAEPIITIVVTLIVGAATLWYTWERAMKLKRERKDGSSKGSD